MLMSEIVESNIYKVLANTFQKKITPIVFGLFALISIYF